MKYKPFTVGKLLKSCFRDKFVKVRGIPRGATANDKTIWGYLQAEDQFIQFNGKYLYPGMPGPTLSLLRASSESELEVTVEGVYSTKTIVGHPGDLKLHRVTLRNVSIEFEE
jgi:hypothetical protein